MIVFKYQGVNCNNSTTLGGVCVDNPCFYDQWEQNYDSRFQEFPRIIDH